MPDPTIGFRARLSCNDGAANAEKFFEDNIVIALPAQEFGEFEDKRLHTPTKSRRFLPTLLDNGTVTAEGYWSKAEYLRLKALLGKTGKVWKLYAPDEDGAAVTLTPLLATLDGWLKKIDSVRFEKDVENKFTFELRVNDITLADGPNDTGAP